MPKAFGFDSLFSKAKRLKGVPLPPAPPDAGAVFLFLASEDKVIENKFYRERDSRTTKANI